MSIILLFKSGGQIYDYATHTNGKQYDNMTRMGDLQLQYYNTLDSLRRYHLRYKLLSLARPGLSDAVGLTHPC